MMMTRLLLLACLILVAVPVAVEARTCIGEPGPGQVCVQDGVTTLELCPKGECTALEIQRLNEVGLGWRGHPLPHDIQITTQDGYICDYHEEPGHQLIASCPHEKPNPTHQEACLALMKEAMKAMDRFRPTKVLEDGIRLSQETRRTGKINESWLAEFSGWSTLAEHEWERSKQGCWGEP